MCHTETHIEIHMSISAWTGIIKFIACDCKYIFRVFLFNHYFCF